MIGRKRAGNHLVGSDEMSLWDLLYIEIIIIAIPFLAMFILFAIKKSVFSDTNPIINDADKEIIKNTIAKAKKMKKERNAKRGEIFRSGHTTISEFFRRKHNTIEHPEVIVPEPIIDTIIDTASDAEPSTSENPINEVVEEPKADPIEVYAKNKVVKQKKSVVEPIEQENTELILGHVDSSYEQKKLKPMDKRKVKQIISMYKKGMKQVDIAKIVGTSPPNVNAQIKKYRDELAGIIKVPQKIGRRTIFSKNMIAKVIEMRKNGVTFEKISEKTGMSKGSIVNFTKNREVETMQKKKPEAKKKGRPKPILTKCRTGDSPGAHPARGGLWASR